MSYTRAQLQTLLSQRLGDSATGTATGGAAAGATLTTTDLIQMPGAKYSSQYCEITSGTYNGNVRRINTATVSSGILTLTPYNAFGGAIVNAVTFNMHRFDPAWKQEAINEILRELHSLLPIPVIEDLISGECLRNGSMEFWRDSATPYDWTASGVVARVAVKYDGLWSLQMAANAAATVTQPIYLTKELYGVGIILTAYVYQAVAADSGTFLRLQQGNTVTDGTGLAVTGAFTQLSVSLTVADAMDPLYATLVQGNTANATYWDQVRLLVPSTAKSSVNWLPYSDYYSELRQVQQGYQQGVTKSVVGGHQVFPMPEFISYGLLRWPYNQRMNVPIWMRLFGDGRYPNLTASTDTVDVNQEEARLVAALAGMKVLDKAEGYEHPVGKEYIESKRKGLSIEIAELRKTIHRPLVTSYQPVPRR